MRLSTLSLTLSTFVLATSACGSPSDSQGGAPGNPTNGSGGDSGLVDAGPGGRPPTTDGSTPPASDGGKPPATGGTTTGYEAEDAFNAGTATLATSITGFSGSGYVDALGAIDAKVVFAVNAAADGTTSITLLYRNGGAAKKVGVYINGAKQSDTTFDPTTTAGFSPHSDTLALRTGLNTVAYVDEDGSSSTVSLDRLDIANGAPRPVSGPIVPFIEYEAEAGQSKGSIVGPDRTYGTIAAEASGRKAVKVEADGDYVEWTTTAAANALVVRYSMPDAPAGGGTTGTLSLYVNGVKRQPLALSSKYAWVYGGYPFNDDPGQGSPHRYFDETRFLIGDVPANAKLRIQRDSGDGPGAITIDLVDTEIAPAAYERPAGSLSITDYGATAGDSADDADALRKAIADAKSAQKILWIPEGVFDLKSRVDVDHVTVRGAGPWHSVFQGASGKGGFNGVGEQVQLIDFAMFGDVTYRNDSGFDGGMDGTVAKGLLIQNVWFDHTKVGIWLGYPSGTSGGYVVGCRIHDTFADGINLTGGTNHTSVEHTHVRNTGDDAFAIWASVGGTDWNRFKWNAAHLPMLANGFAIYGGGNNSIEDSEVYDTVDAAAGIAISTRNFGQNTPFSGTTSVLRTNVNRAGGHEPNWNTNFGGIWVFTETSAISSPVVFRDVSLNDGTYQGILLSADPSNKPITNVLFERVAIDGASSYGVEVEAPGSGTFNAVTVTGASAGGSKLVPSFTATKGAGTTGW